MELAEKKLLELLCVNTGTTCSPHTLGSITHTCRDLLDEHGVRLNIVGKIEFLPQSVQRAVRKAE